MFKHKVSSTWSKSQGIDGTANIWKFWTVHRFFMKQDLNFKLKKIDLAMEAL